MYNRTHGLKLEVLSPFISRSTNFKLHMSKLSLPGLLCGGWTVVWGLFGGWSGEVGDGGLMLIGIKGIREVLPVAGME